MTESLELKKEQQASELIRSDSFQKKWAVLYRECRWSTPFQSPGFVITWFQVYTNQTPIIVTKISEDGTLNGLLVLSRDVTGKIDFAGTHHAEYKGWLENNNGAHEFIGLSLDLVRHHFGPFALNLSYIYHEEQAEILTRECANFIELIPCSREYKNITRDTVIPSLKKKGNKSKWNRLGKLGSIEFSRISDPDIFRKYLEICSIYHDVWQGAMNNCYPFSSDPSKLDFHAKLFERDQGIFHVSGMTLDNEPIALHIGYIQDKEICYSIIAHNPVYSSYSLGKLLLLRLCELLLNEGFTSLDLSPGNDLWKKDFSSDRATSYKGVLHKTAFLKSLHSHLHKVIRTASHIGLSGSRIRLLTRKARHLFANLLSSPCQRQDLLIYRSNGSHSNLSVEKGYHIRKNDLSDLLLYQHINSGISKRQFLKESIRRLTEGEDVYTYSNNGKLLACGWLKNKQTADYFSEVGQEYNYDPPGNVLHDIYVQPEPGNQVLYSALIGHMLDDSIHHTGSHIYYVTCNTNNRALIKFIENDFGFRVSGALHLARCFNLSRRWKTHRADEAVSVE